MKTFAPSYYNKFKCIADKCRHSCCVGWEIDIDDDTYEHYKNNNTEFGNKLKENIEVNNGCASFKLCENERCPFLNKKNLCEIILNLGENSLCQICNDHPRFRNFYSDRVEIGLGICCEEVARIILSETEPFELITIDDDGEEKLNYEDELEIFNLRNKLFEIIKCDLSFEMIVQKMLNQFNIIFPQKSVNEWVDIYLPLERLDNNWDELLNTLKSTEKTNFSCSYHNEKALKNLLTYFIYRHLSESIYDGMFKGRLLFSILSCYMISALCNFELNIEDIARMYSSEIEYSDENLNTLIELLQNESLEA